MIGIVTVYAVFGSEEEALRIGRACVEERLAACVNLLGSVHSIYRWQGRIEEGAEVAALFKTDAAGAGALITRIGALHSYDVPAAVAWPLADALPAFADWVRAETGGEG
ncbi:MAG TPA: divalent-cation tolerance protein CutA [Allosphingosinicella sp.]|jgi:periplasmic divalent cation tolerance protein